MDFKHRLIEYFKGGAETPILVLAMGAVALVFALKIHDCWSHGR